MTKYKMFSSTALQHFRRFAEEAGKPSKPSGNRGAFDVMPRKRMGRDAEYGSQKNMCANSTSNNAIADDGPDPEHVSMVMSELEKHLTPESAERLRLALNSRWPDVCEMSEVPVDDEGDVDDEGEVDHEEGEDEEEAGSYWPGENREERRNSDPPNNSNLTGANDDPLPFRGMPRTGGKMAGDSSFASRFPNAARIKVDNYGVRAQPKRAKRTVKQMAQDSAASARAQRSFQDRFPHAARIKVL